jgi:hypothetical protein
MNQPNPFAMLGGLMARLEALKALASKVEGLQADFKMRIDMMFADIGPDTPVARGIRAHGDSLVDLIDGIVHAVQTLEKRLLSQDKAA